MGRDGSDHQGEFPNPQSMRDRHLELEKKRGAGEKYARRNGED